MSELRFSYNPFTDDFVKCTDGQAHSLSLHNQGKQKLFDEYIRGIILDDILYLRLYYPFDNLSDLNSTQLKQRSRDLLEQYRSKIRLLILKEYKITPKEIKFNVKNDLLEGIGLANI